MTTQQIQFVAPGIAELRKIPLEAPAPGMVTVRLAVSSISSGTERANLIGDPNISYARSGEETNPWTLDYELDLYKTVLKCCAVKE